MEIHKFGFYFLLGVIIAIAFKLYTIIYAFFPAIMAACVFAYLFEPLYLSIHKIVKSRSISAFSVVFIIILLILIPITFIASAVQSQIQSVMNENTLDTIRNAYDNFNNFVQTKFDIMILDYISDIVPSLFSTAQGAITSLAPKMIFSITGYILSTFITIFLMYYFLINSNKVVKTFREYFPLSYKNSRVLLEKLGKDTKALIFGQLLIAIIQGVLGATGFYLFGISGAILWGLAMVVMSFLPFLGASIIWFPAAVILLLQKEYFNCAGLVLWGVLIVSTVDNLIRPKLTSALGKIHPVTVLLGVFIGIKEWGFIGIVIGPLFITALIILIKMFREEYIEENTAEDSPS